MYPQASAPLSAFSRPSDDLSQQSELSKPVKLRLDGDRTPSFGMHNGSSQPSEHQERRESQQAKVVPVVKQSKQSVLKPSALKAAAVKQRK